MKTREEVIRQCLSYPNTYEDYPFNDSWAIIRHKHNKKMFAAIFPREDGVWVNLKAEPMWGDFWKNAYAAVVPAYHMNKEHWISVILNGTVDEEDICRMIFDSYTLTKGK